MNTPTAWEERTVVKDAPAIMDAALKTCRPLSMDGFSCSLDLDDLTPFYHLDEGQPQTWDQPYIPPTVSIVRIESPKLPGVNLLPLFDKHNLWTFRNYILTAGDDE